jgi:hypothetical protein
MHEKQSRLLVQSPLAALIPAVGFAEPTEKTYMGMEWGRNTGSQNRFGGILNNSATLYVGLMNPNHWQVSDWPTLATLMEE